MSRIKEQLIGYETSDWISKEDHVRVTELEEHILYAMTVVEMQQTAKERLRYDLYTTPKAEFDKLYYDTIGVHNK